MNFDSERVQKYWKYRHETDKKFGRFVMIALVAIAVELFRNETTIPLILLVAMVGVFSYFELECFRHWFLVIEEDISNLYGKDLMNVKRKTREDILKEKLREDVTDSIQDK